MSHRIDEKATATPPGDPRLEWEFPTNQERPAPRIRRVAPAQPCHDRCQSERHHHASWACQRPMGHTGRHAAYTFTHIVAVWKREVKR